MRIIALDPGGTTGYATFEVRDELIRWSSGQLGPQFHHAALEGTFEAFQPDVIVSESFEYRNRSRPGLELVSCEYIGVAHLWCAVNGVPLVLQTAAMGKVTNTTFVKKENLVKLDLYRPNMKHAMDAYGHLLYFLIHNIKTEPIRTELLRKGWGKSHGDNK